jgi:hypothetical protein
VELLEAYPEVKTNFKNAGWYEFVTTFQGNNEKISMLFKQNFDGYETLIDNVLISITEYYIPSTYKLYLYGQKWWKKNKLLVDLANHFMVPKHQKPN